MRRFLFIGVAIVIGSIFLLILIGNQLRRTGTGNLTTTNPQPTGSVRDNAKTQIVAMPSKAAVAVGETFTIAIHLDSGENVVNGVQLAFSYDPKIIAIDTVSQGTFFEKPFELANTNDINTGKILYALGSTNEKKGIGIVATLTARALSATKGQQQVLTIEPTSLVAEFKNTKSSVLKSAEGATIVIR